MIALDIVEHFKAKIRPNGFKAQVVAPSRAAALRYAAHLNDFGLNAYPVITTAPNDGPKFDVARQLPQEQIVNSFVDPEGEPEILVVVDMLLTGFDAPVEQVLYLDRSLREHGLLQAIARVNRRFSHRKDGVETEKIYGLVVDYHGVSRNLEDALSTFDWPDVQDSMRELEEEPGPVIEAAAVQAESHFKDRDLNRVWDCVEGLRARRQYRRQFQGRRFRAVQRRLPGLLSPHGPVPAGPKGAGLHRPACATHRDSGLRARSVPPGGCGSGLDRDRRESQASDGHAHLGTGAGTHASRVHPRPGL